MLLFFSAGNFSDSEVTAACAALEDLDCELPRFGDIGRLMESEAAARDKVSRRRMAVSASASASASASTSAAAAKLATRVVEEGFAPSLTVLKKKLLVFVNSFKMIIF